jgi:hypothetical protein
MTRPRVACPRPHPSAGTSRDYADGAADEASASSPHRKVDGGTAKLTGSAINAAGPTVFSALTTRVSGSMHALKLVREVVVEQAGREPVRPLLHGVGDVNEHLAGQGLTQPPEYLDGHRTG